MDRQPQRPGQDKGLEEDAGEVRVRVRVRARVRVKARISLSEGEVWAGGQG